MKRKRSPKDSLINQHKRMAMGERIPDDTAKRKPRKRG